MNLTVDEVHKMKVVELKAELQLRNLDPKGVKAVLIDRLIAALGGTPIGGVGNGNFAASKDEDDEPEIGSPKQDNSPVKASSPAKQLTPTTTTPQESELGVDSQSPTPASAPTSPVKTPTALAPTSPVKTPIAPAPTTPVKTPTPAVESPVKASTPAVVSPAKPVVVSPVKIPNPLAPAANANNTTPALATPAIKVENQSPNKTPAAEPMETNESENNCSAKRKLDSDAEVKQETKKAKTEPTPAPPKVVVEDEPAFDENAVLLDWYKSDLNLKISKENFLEAEPIVSDEFPFAYGGAKATYGFMSGKLFYEVKFVKAMDVRADFGDLEFKHILRVGWSDLLTGLQLGQEVFSYGFESKAKIYKGGEISDYGETLAEGDVVGVYLDIGSEFLEMKFTKNGVVFGDPVQIPKADVEGKTWFPHILVRNVKFSANFGGSEPAHPPLEGYTFVGNVASSPTRVRGPKRPEKKDECELIMLVGLACSGKTTWAKEYVKNNAEKNYIILGTSTVVERSVKDPSVITAPKGPKAYEGFMNRAGKFVEKLVDLAPSRRRNYILDQSNVLPSVQRRKCGGFEGFKRKAVIILPSDEEYQKRIKSKEQEQGKSVPKSTILDMKASFQLPEVGELFSEVEFPELAKADAEKVVSTYNKEGVDAGYGRSGSGKGNQRGGYYGRGRGFMPRGRGGFMRGGPRGGRGGGMMMRGPPRPPMRGGPPMRGPPPVPFRGRGRGMGPPPPMRGGPPAGMNGASRFGGPPARGGPRGGAPQRGGAPLQRGGGGGGSWQRAAGPGSVGNGFRATPRPQGRGGSMAPRWNAPKPMNNNNSRPPPQVWQQQPPPQQQSVWNTGFNNFGGQQQQQQPQQFIDPWVQHQQVPDQGFGRSWDNMGNNNMQQNANRGGGGGGTWQGYGGQQFGGGFGGGRR